MIEVENLTKYYGNYPVLRDINFNVEPGEILGFLGPNGAGKTTTMRIITGYLPPTSGTIKVAGFDMAEHSLEARRHIGYLPETVPLYTDLTTYEYLDFRGRICGLTRGKERKERIYEVIDELNLGDVVNKLTGKLSRGFRQRVGLAQALLHNPDVLILDEPTVGLDPVQITDVRNLIKELGQNHTIILSTHLLPEVSMVCDRVIIINRGRLAVLDTPINMVQGVAENHRIQLEIAGKPVSVLQTLRGIAGVAQAILETNESQSARANGSSSKGTVLSTPSDQSLESGVYTYQVDAEPGSDLRSSVADAVVREGYQLLELKSVRLSLEDVFLQVIARETEAEVEGEDDYEDIGDDLDETDEDYEDEPQSAAAKKVMLVKRTRR